MHFVGFILHNYITMQGEKKHKSVETYCKHSSVSKNPLDLCEYHSEGPSESEGEFMMDRELVI